MSNAVGTNSAEQGMHAPDLAGGATLIYRGPGTPRSRSMSGDHARISHHHPSVEAAKAAATLVPYAPVQRDWAASGGSKDNDILHAAEPRTGGSWIILAHPTTPVATPVRAQQVKAPKPEPKPKAVRVIAPMFTPQAKITVTAEDLQRAHAAMLAAKAQAAAKPVKPCAHCQDRAAVARGLCQTDYAYVVNHYASADYTQRQATRTLNARDRRRADRLRDAADRGQLALI